MTTETAAKKDIQKLQRAIVDGLEDVKAQDIQVFNTEKLSPLFERVMIASGTSNRQTKALAASVRDSVREAGFPKPRMEGEENGEWIIVDCGQAVVHIMQPAIRQYYHLEDLWGDSPVRLKFGADKPVVKATPKTAAKSEPASTSLRRSSAAKQAAASLPTRAQLKKADAGKAKPAGAKRASAKPGAPKSAAPRSAPKSSAKPSVNKPGVKKPAAKSAPKVVKVNKPAAPKPAAKKVVAKKAPAKKPGAARKA
jgi:ribosome-associated protein